MDGRLGRDPQIGIGTFIDPDVNLRIGDSFVTGPNVHIIPGECLGILIGNNVSIAHGSFIRSSNHSYFDLKRPIQEQGHFTKRVVADDGRQASIIIEDDVLISAYCVILAGARIGNGSVIAAGSVLASEIPPYSIVVGNPARVVANRTKRMFDQSVIKF